MAYYMVITSDGFLHGTCTLQAFYYKNCADRSWPDLSSYYDRPSKKRWRPGEGASPWWNNHAKCSWSSSSSWPWFGSLAWVAPSRKLWVHFTRLGNRGTRISIQNRTPTDPPGAWPSPHKVKISKSLVIFTEIQWGPHGAWPSPKSRSVLIFIEIQHPSQSQNSNRFCNFKTKFKRSMGGMKVELVRVS